MEKIRIMLVDDHPFLRRGLCGEINLLKDMVVVGEANDGLEAVELARTLQPDLVLMDIYLPLKNGVEAAREIIQNNSEIQVLMLSGYSDDKVTLSAIKAGASGFICKDSPPDKVIQAIRQVHAGEYILNSRIARKLFEEIRGEKQESSSLQVLTERELEILGYMAKGMSNREIAYQACIAESTVRSHVHHILNKLEIPNRAQAILYAVKKGIVEVGA